MTVAEWINFSYFSFFLVFALLYRLPSERRARAIRMAFAGIILLVAPQFLQKFFPSRFASVFRDWMPLALMLLAYWLPGNFFVNPNHKLTAKLQQIDSQISKMIPWLAHLSKGNLGAYLELAYLFCYPFVPLGFAFYYALEPRPPADEFWITVLLPSYICYALLPFTQTLPPWKLGDTDPSHQAGWIRKFNFIIVKRASTQANTFPSAHVAASLAVSLVLLSRDPTIGMLFSFGALSIATSAFAGRYHYAVDVVTGALLAIAIFLAFAFRHPASVALLF